MMQGTEDHGLDDKARVVLLQPAFLGDAVLSSAILESWHRAFPNHALSIVVRDAAAGLFQNHPFLDAVHVWNRSGWLKYPRLLQVAQGVRSSRPQVVVNLHRFTSMAMLAQRSGAPHVTGFLNPGKWQSKRAHLVGHGIGDGRHETERNHAQVARYLGEWDPTMDRPALHPTPQHHAAAEAWPSGALILAPASVWATKRWPESRWAGLADRWAQDHSGQPIVLLGGKGDKALLGRIAQACTQARPLICAGDLNLLGAAALMAKADLVVSNDSAPLHMAGAVGTAVVAVFCSTTPRFGFGVLPAMKAAGSAAEVEVGEDALECKPCGLHGHKVCPKQHFRCGNEIEVDRVIAAMRSVSSPRG
ncbi:MAG: glycosyltransferase family 9 protein [Flavobacteriales bacterium]|nr:glycosyltransferase family 9 protein [Flavobacteriales bacterium]